MKRLGLGHRITALLSPELSLPAVGQGALGIECLAGRTDLVKLVRPLHHLTTAQCVEAERAMSRALGGSCQVPLGGFAEIKEEVLRLRGFVASQDGTRMISDELSGEPGAEHGDRCTIGTEAEGSRGAKRSWRQWRSGSLLNP